MLAFFKHEFRLIWREPRFWIPFLIPPIFIMVSQLYLKSQAAEGLMGANLLILIGVLLSTMSVNLMADSFAGERERNTLELLLTLPVSIEKIFFGKLLAVFPVPLALSLLFQSLFWNLTELSARTLLVAMVTNSFSCLFVGSVALSISMFASTVRTAAQISVLCVLSVLIITPIYSIYIYDSLSVFLTVNGFYFLTGSALTLVAFSIFKKRLYIK